MRKLGCIISVSVLMFACSPKIKTGLSKGAVLYTPVENDATDSVSYDQLLAGRKLFVAKCGSCHYLKLPQTLTEPQWRKAIDKMQPKAKISNEEKKSILNFPLVRAKKQTR